MYRWVLIVPESVLPCAEGRLILVFGRAGNISEKVFGPRSCWSVRMDMTSKTIGIGYLSKRFHAVMRRSCVRFPGLASRQGNLKK